MSQTLRPKSRRALSAKPHGLLAGPPGWLLSPEGAAIHESSRAAVVADIHLGYEWARSRAGDMVPPHSLAETLARLDRLHHRFPLARLIVAGDLVESHHLCRRTTADLATLRAWLESRQIQFTPLRGNHDPATPAAGPLTIQLDDSWTIAHGHHPLPAAPRAVTGHLHPSLKVQSVTTPCFLVGPDTIILPAFSSNAAGWNILGPWPPGLESRAPRCIAALGDTILDFGPIAPLRSQLLGTPP